MALRLSRLVTAAVVLVLAVLCAVEKPEDEGNLYAAVYDAGKDKASPISLRIGNGGAGENGLVKALAEAFIKHRVAANEKPFRVAWYVSDTTASIKALKLNVVDVAITYNSYAEDSAIKQGIAKSPSYYIFRDHFLLVGPKANPANLSELSDILTMLAQISDSGDRGDSNPPTRFLSRYDKSATNIKESLLWAKIGQVPWAIKYSKWYHQYIRFPLEALSAAIQLQEYTLTDRGTLLSIDTDKWNQTVIYKAGGDEADDLLLNPARLLIGSQATNSVVAEAFAKWLVSDKGQSVITAFKKGSEQLYSAAPSKT